MLVDRSRVISERSISLGCLIQNEVVGGDGYKDDIE
jgi:hypothetical protein